MSYPRMATYKTATDLRRYLSSLGAALPLDDTLIHGDLSPLTQTFVVDGQREGNRFAILPMEGWDATADGQPSDMTLRRWQRFGASGAKLTRGGKPVSVRHD